MQSYDFFSIVVSVTHGKGIDKTKLEAVKNQSVTKGNTPYPMENCC
jgi:hypothetical protein